MSLSALRLLLPEVQRASDLRGCSILTRGTAADVAVSPTSSEAAGSSPRKTLNGLFESAPGQA